MPPVTLILRGVQALFAFLVLCLSAAAINKFSVFVTLFGGLPFLLFCSLFSLLSLAYLILSPKFLPQMQHVYINLVLELINALFWFSGFIAVAVQLGIPCAAISDVEADIGLSNPDKTPCDCSRAASAFGAFSWLLWLASAVLDIHGIYRGGRQTAPPPPHPMDVDNKGMPLDHVQPNDGQQY